MENGQMTGLARSRQRKSWIRRNWPWLIAGWLALCLTGASIALFGMHSSEAREMAISKAESSPALDERLGKPLKFGWFSSGEIEVNEASGHANLAISVSGPRGKGTLYVESRKEAGQRYLDLLQFADEQGRLDLLR